MTSLRRPSRRSMSIGLTLALATTLTIVAAGPQAVAGLTLRAGSSATTTFSVHEFDTTTPRGSTPIFVNDVLLYPGSTAYPVLRENPTIQQTPTRTAARIDGNNFTHRASASPTVINSVLYGSAESSTTLSRSISNGGTVVQNSTLR